MPASGWRKRCSRFPASLRSSIQLARLKLGQNDLHGAEEVLKTGGGKRAEIAGRGGGRWASCICWPSQPEHAEPEFRKALALDAKTGVALMGLAAIQIAGKRMDEAEETLRQVSALPGKQYKPQHAVFLYRNGKRDEALKEFEALAKADPEDRAARTRVVSLYFAMGKFPQAESLLAAVAQEESKRHRCLAAAEPDVSASGQGGRSAERPAEGAALHAEFGASSPGFSGSPQTSRQ